MNTELGCVKIKDGVAVAELLAEGVVAAHRVDFLAGVLGHIGHLMEHLPPAQRQIAAGNVQTGHKQIAAGGGLRQVDDLPHISGVDIGAGQQQARLRQAASAFVHRNRGHIRPRRHGGNRQPAAEIEVRAVGLVRKAEHTGVMGHPHNGAQVTADTVVSGVIHQHSHRVRVLSNRLGHLLTLHAQADTQPVIDLRVDVDRHSAAEHQRIQHTAVDVARQDDFVPALAGRQHHALHRAGCAAHHQKRVCRAKGVSCQLLCLADDRNRVAEIVQRLHAVDVHADALFPQKSRQLRVAAPTLVARHIKRHHAHFAERLQRFMNRCTPLVEAGAFSLSVHFFLRSRFLCKQKSASHAQMYRLALKFSIFCTGRNTPGLAPREHFYRMIQKG